MQRYLSIILSVLSLIMLCLPGCTSEDRLTGSLFAEHLDADILTLGGSPLLIPAYGEIYTTGTITVECTVAGLYYIIEGASTEGEMNGFDSDNLCRIIYTDITPDRICMIAAHLTVSVPLEDCPSIITLQIYINGVIADPASLAGDYITANDNAEAIAISCLREFDQGDYIQLWISSSRANTTVAINTLTFSLTTVD